MMDELSLYRQLGDIDRKLERCITLLQTQNSRISKLEAHRDKMMWTVIGACLTAVASLAVVLIQGI